MLPCQPLFYSSIWKGKSDRLRHVQICMCEIAEAWGQYAGTRWTLARLITIAYSYAKVLKGLKPGVIAM